LTCIISSTGEITREEALILLKEPTCDSKLLEDDKEYLLKKFEINSEEFDRIINLPVKSIYDYPNTHKLELKFRFILHKLRTLKILPN
jgi:hypothetical protein